MEIAKSDNAAAIPIATVARRRSIPSG